MNISLDLLACVLGFCAISRKVRGQGDVQLPGKLIDRSFEFALLISALSNHQLNVFIVKNTDEITFRITVVQGNIIYLEDIPKKKTQFCPLLSCEEQKKMMTLVRMYIIDIQNNSKDLSLF